MRHRWLSVVLAFGLVSVLAIPALAGGLTVFGGKIETGAETGRDYSYSMKVQNTSDASLDIAVEIKGYGTESENPFVVLDPADDASHHSARQYLAVAPSAFHLASAELREIVVSANIPQDTEAGGKYAIVYIHTVPKSGSVATTAGMAARVLLTVEGSRLSHTSQITAVSLVSGKSLQALVELANDGNQHYKPHLRGTLRKGDKVLALASTDDLWPVIPHYSRQFGLSFRPAETLPAGDYDLDVEVLDELEAMVAQQTSTLKLNTAYAPVADLPSSALAPSVAKVPAAPVSIVLKPSAKATLATEDETISINFPQGAVISQVPLTLRGDQAENAPPAPADYQIGGTCFKVEGLNGLLAKEATLTVKYSANDLQSAGGDASRLVLARWDEGAGQWTVLKTRVDRSNMTLTATTDRFSTWAVMARPAGSSHTLLFSIAGVGAVLVMCGLLLVLRRKRRRWIV
jgi:hypothetical protein